MVNTLFLVTHSYVSQVTHAFLGMLPLFLLILNLLLKEKMVSGARLAIKMFIGFHYTPKKFLLSNYLVIDFYSKLVIKLTRHYLKLVMSNRDNFTIDYRDTIEDQLSIDNRKYRIQWISLNLSCTCISKSFKLMATVVRIYEALLINYLYLMITDQCLIWFKSFYLYRLNGYFSGKRYLMPWMPFFEIYKGNYTESSHVINVRDYW